MQLLLPRTRPAFFPEETVFALFLLSSPTSCCSTLTLRKNRAEVDRTRPSRTGGFADFQATQRCTRAILRGNRWRLSASNCIHKILHLSEIALLREPRRPRRCRLRPYFQPLEILGHHRDARCEGL